jgi:hypothetical protein
MEKAINNTKIYVSSFRFIIQICHKNTKETSGFSNKKAAVRPLASLNHPI